MLAAPTRDIAAAEDALADALERALARWPDDGIPRNPDGWVLTVARNRLRDIWKSAAYRTTTGHRRDPLCANRFGRRHARDTGPAVWS